MALQEAGSELWLLQAGAGVDLSSLDGLTFKNVQRDPGGLSLTLDGSDYTFADAGMPCSATQLLVPAAEGSTHTTYTPRLFSRNLVITRRLASPAEPARRGRETRRHIDQPAGMRVRFVPIGSGASLPPSPGAPRQASARDKGKRKKKSASSPGDASTDRPRKKSKQKDKRSPAGPAPA